MRTALLIPRQTPHHYASRPRHPYSLYSSSTFAIDRAFETIRRRVDHSRTIPADQRLISSSAGGLLPSDLSSTLYKRRYVTLYNADTDLRYRVLRKWRLYVSPRQGRCFCLRPLLAFGHESLAPGVERIHRVRCSRALLVQRHCAPSSL